MVKKTGTENEEASNWTWKNEKTCIIGQSSNHNSEKIASFDMDSTLIETKSGAKFAQNATDWIYWNECVPKKLKEYSENGFKIVIFTNQKGISTGNAKAEHIKQKIQDIANDIGIEIQALIATHDDEYRKPNTKMWELFVEHNGKVDMAQSFYCGDAAGRKNGKKKDFSDSDLKFALNVGLEFKTPENFFLNDKTVIKVEGFNPQDIPQNGALFANSPDTDVKFVEKEMVIFSGSPGSGKSTFWKNYLPKYERVNRDTLKTKEKCYAAAENFLKAGKSVVIDNTNPKAEDRKYFLGLAKKLGVKARCFYFLTPKPICMHNDGQRINNTVREHFSKRVGKMPVNMWWSKQEKPTEAEGFYEVKEVNFIAKFDNEADKAEYLKF